MLVLKSDILRQDQKLLDTIAIHQNEKLLADGIHRGEVLPEQRRGHDQVEAERRKERDVCLSRIFELEEQQTNLKSQIGELNDFHQSVVRDLRFQNLERTSQLRKDNRKSHDTLDENHRMAVDQMNEDMSNHPMNLRNCQLLDQITDLKEAIANLRTQLNEATFKAASGPQASHERAQQWKAEAALIQKEAAINFQKHLF